MAVFAARFSGRTAVVTGGASGIGLGVAQRLVAEGARVAIWDQDGTRAAEAASRCGGETWSLAVDVTDADAVARASVATAERLGSIHVLVAAAGISGPSAPAWEYPVDEWRRVIEINLVGLFLCNREIAKVMREQDFGRIVNLASISGKDGSPNASAYSASKAGVIGFTKAIAKELAKTRITVNCVTPTLIQTPMYDQLSETIKTQVLSGIPMGRVGQIDEVVSLITWLASDEASYSTGAVFDLSGGRATY